MKTDRKLLDVKAYLAHYKVTTKKVFENKAGNFYILETCVFGHDQGSHKTAIMQKPAGGLEYSCDHPDCKNKLWATARQKISGSDRLTQFIAGAEEQSEGDNADSIKTYPLTDLGNVERLMERYARDLRYSPHLKKWFIWDGKRWRLDELGVIYMFAKHTSRSIMDEEEVFEGDAKYLRSFARGSENLQRIRAMIELASKHESITVRPDIFDQDPWLLNCLNGTIDLRTKELLPHNPDHMITKLVPVEFDPEAKCPLFDNFLHTIMHENDDLIGFLRRALGYALTGITKEECMFFLYGIGANGKSTLIETLRAIIGEYSRQTDMNTFLERRSESVRNDIAMLKGTRFVTAVEAEDGKHLSESVVKQMTGQDKVTARFLYGEFFEYMPTFKIFVGTNYKPIIKGIDEGIWRRIVLIPFEVTIPKEKRDHQLKEKLLTELPGILAWAVQGCLEWQKQGLNAPAEIIEAVSEYRGDMDLLSDFLESESIVIGDGIKVRSRDIYKAYQKWCEEEGLTALRQTTFGRKLGLKGFTRHKASGTNWWHGVGLRNKIDVILNTHPELLAHLQN